VSVPQGRQVARLAAAKALDDGHVHV
jgi:hypothetical protein